MACSLLSQKKLRSLNSITIWKNSHNLHPLSRSNRCFQKSWKMRYLRLSNTSQHLKKKHGCMLTLSLNLSLLIISLKHSIQRWSVSNFWVSEDLSEKLHKQILSHIKSLINMIQSNMLRGTELYMSKLFKKKWALTQSSPKHLSHQREISKTWRLFPSKRILAKKKINQK